MNTKRIKMGQWVILFTLAMAQVACDNAIFSSDGSNAKATDGGNTSTGEDPDPEVVEDLVFLDDSFERDDISIDLVNNVIYGWRGFILDGATSVFGFQSNGAGARIPLAEEYGPAADGERFLLLNGRENADAVETIHVISQNYDLSVYNTALLTFRYLTFGLNDAGDVVPENLRLQVCRGTLNECGANDDALNAAGLQSDKWVTVFTSQELNDDTLNGKNHLATDWKAGVVAIDLRDPNFVGDASTFVFRFVSALRDGVTPDSCTGGGTGECTCEKECHKKKHCHRDNGKHLGFDHSKHYGYGKHNCQDEEKKCDCEKSCEKDCKHDNGKHVGFDHSKHYGYGKHGCKDKKCCQCKCTCVENPVECVKSDGSLKDGVAIDKVMGIATQRTIEEIF